MKNKYEPNKRKPIEEISTKKKYNGEASPYWDFMESHQRVTEEGNPIEDTLANPDVLSEEDSLYNRPLSEDGELRVRIIHEVMATLPPQQLRILKLCGFEGYTEEAAAELLGIKRRTLRTLMSRIKQKIERLYEQRNKAEGR